MVYSPESNQDKDTYEKPPNESAQDNIRTYGTLLIIDGKCSLLEYKSVNQENPRVQIGAADTLRPQHLKTGRNFDGTQCAEKILEAFKAKPSELRKNQDGGNAMPLPTLIQSYNAYVRIIGILISDNARKWQHEETIPEASWEPYDDRSSRGIEKEKEKEKEPLNLAANLSNWLTNLPEKLKKVPIIYLSIPGSHNTMTYDLLKERSPDFNKDEMGVLGSDWLGFLTNGSIRDWATCQGRNIGDQLKNGIRYLDFRVADKGGVCKFCHGLYSDTSVNSALRYINGFLNKNPGEFVIIDFQKFYAFNSGTHVKLVKDIHDILGDKLASFDNDKFKYMTYRSMVDCQKQQVIIIYRNESVAEEHKFWKGWKSIWANTTNLDTMLRTINNELPKVSMDIGVISQYVLTANSDISAWDFTFKSLKTRLVEPNAGAIVRAVRSKPPSQNKRSTNIAIADFVDLNSWAFCKTVINNNNSLIEEEIEIKKLI